VHSGKEMKLLMEMSMMTTMQGIYDEERVEATAMAEAIRQLERLARGGMHAIDDDAAVDTDDAGSERVEWR
jgi:hypothetical protein